MIHTDILVIGAGPAGLSAAITAGAAGANVLVLERSHVPGGQLVKQTHMFFGSGEQYASYRGFDISDILLGQISGLPNVILELNATALAAYDDGIWAAQTVSGYTKIYPKAVIVATGASEQKPTEYLYGQNKRIITQLELEEQMKQEATPKQEQLLSPLSISSEPRSGDAEATQRIVMIQCVGRKYCSRVCCNQAIKNALALKQQQPETDITILYRDIRSYGMSELNYRQARQIGIKFIRYEEDNKPQISIEEQAAGHLQIKIHDSILNETLTLKADLLVLSSVIQPNQNLELAQKLKVPLNQDGFFLEAHVKLRPVDFATEGIYVCGLAHAPKSISESIIQGRAAAGRAATVIAKNQLQTEGAIANTIAENCAACGDCTRVCAYNAIEIKDGRAQINEVLCKGCGTCSAACRCGALDICGFSDKQILTEIEYLLHEAI